LPGLPFGVGSVLLAFFVHIDWLAIGLLGSGGGLVFEGVYILFRGHRLGQRPLRD
jgi:hypothetical protein